MPIYLSSEYIAVLYPLSLPDLNTGTGNVQAALQVPRSHEAPLPTQPKKKKEEKQVTSTPPPPLTNPTKKKTCLRAHENSNTKKGNSHTIKF